MLRPYDNTKYRAGTGAGPYGYRENARFVPTAMNRE